MAFFFHYYFYFDVFVERERGDRLDCGVVSDVYQSAAINCYDYLTTSTDDQLQNITANHLLQHSTTQHRKEERDVPQVSTGYSLWGLRKSFKELFTKLLHELMNKTNGPENNMRNVKCFYYSTI